MRLGKRGTFFSFTSVIMIKFVREKQKKKEISATLREFLSSIDALNHLMLTKASFSFSIVQFEGGMRVSESEGERE